MIAHQVRKATDATIFNLGSWNYELRAENVEVANDNQACRYRCQIC